MIVSIIYIYPPLLAGINQEIHFKLICRLTNNTKQNREEGEGGEGAHKVKIVKNKKMFSSLNTAYKYGLKASALAQCV